MSKRILTTPVPEEEVRSLKAGDLVYVTGTLVTGRDAVHARVVREGKTPAVDLSGGALYHAGPIIRTKEDGTYEVVACGPTTSMRMESVEDAFLKTTGVRLLIGKGGMGEATARACATYGAAHLIFPGGCAVLAAECVEEVEGVFWEDLGMAEAAWVLRVKEFGPLLVSIDAEGNNLMTRQEERP